MQATNSNSKDVPKHLQNNKKYKERLAKEKAEKRGNVQVGSVLIVIAIIIGAGLFVYNMDEVYLRDKKNITMSYSTAFKQGGSTPIIVTLTDFDDSPIEAEEVMVELEYEQNNRTKILELATDKTNDNGAVTPIIELPKDFNGTAKLVVSVGEQKLEQEIKIEEPTEPGVVSGEEHLKILISTDKPLYKPGQTINIRTLAIYGENKGVYTENIVIEIDDPEGSKLFRTEQDCNEWGIASTNFTVTDQMSLGNYKVLAKVGETEAKKSVTVKDYVLPRFQISFSDVKSWYTVDEDITGTIHCKYFFGKVVKGEITFKARTFYGGIWDEIYQISGSLSEAGEFEFKVPAVDYAVGLSINQDNGLVELNATVTDPSGHSETKLMPVSIARKPILVTAISDTNIRGAESRYYILTQAPDGSIVDNANVTATVDNVQVFSGTTNDKGLAEVKFTYEAQKELGITAEKSNLETVEKFTIQADAGIKLVADKMFYSVGERASFEIFYNGESFTRWVYYDVISNGFTVTTGCFKLSSGSVKTGEFTIDLTPEMVGTSYIRVFKIEKDEDVVSDRLGLAIAPVNDLDISIEKDDTIYNPHQSVILKFKVTEGGSAVQAALGVSIIDQSLYELSERFGGFTDLFFELEQTALEPRYQIWEYVFDIDSSAKSIPLPETNIIDPGAYEEGVKYAELGLRSNWYLEQDNAEETKNDYVNIYWTAVFIIVFLCFTILAFYGIRKSKPYLVIVLLGLLVAVTVVGGVILNLEELALDEEAGKVSKGGLPGGGEGESEAEAEAEAEGEWIDDMEKAGMGQEEFDEGNGWPAPPGPAINIIDRDTGWDGDKSNTIPMDNTSIEDPLTKREPGEVRVRDYFPETWYWNPVLITDEAGIAELDTLITPDSITTWEIKAVASTKEAKLGVNNENLTVFQQFFIEPDIPVSVIRNDTFPLRIMVYNYDNISRDIIVYLDEASWFEALDKTTQTVTVPADNVSKVIFTIRALEAGEHNVTVSGFNGKAWDDVIRPLRVDPDGKRVSETINGKLTDNQSVLQKVTLSPERVPNSEDAFIKLQAGMEAVLLDGAESFIRYVSGCGEQSMSSLNIDILAFDTVQKLGTATEEKMFEYEHMVTQGIQHELQYLVAAKNGKGRGIVWFPSDDDVHQWLTSWGLITFQDAIDAGFAVDQEIITDMQTWLLSQQETDGSFIFPERGLYEFTNPILRAKTVSCSAYITRSLIYSGYSPTSASIQAAVDYIEDHAKDNWDDPYTIALVLIVLEDANGDSTLRNELATRLEELKIEDLTNGTVYWSSGTSMITDSDFMEFDMAFGRGYGYGSNYHSIETTGYAVMALAKHKGSASSTVQKGVKFLIENRQGLGGWFSTQDTVVAFQALKVAGTNSIDKLDVEIYAGATKISTITFDDRNVDLTYIIDLRPYLQETTSITLQSIGVGSVMYQIYYEEYIPWAIIGADEPPELLLNIIYDTTNIKVNDRIKATLELEYVGIASHVKMVLVDLRAPVGFSFIEDDFIAMLDDGKISQYEINNRQAYLYIEDLTYGQKITVTYHLEANDPIRGTIQGIEAYDMYNPNLKAELEPIEITASE